MKKLHILFILSVISLLSQANTTADAANRHKTATAMELRVIETSDMHGSFFPYDFLNRREKAGSTARVSSYVKSLRQQYGDRLLLLDNGDILQGQPLSYFSNFIDTTDTNIAAQVVNYLRYDAQTIGNHDIEPGHKVYDKWMRELNCPVLGANIIDTRTGQPYVKPYVILQRNGVRIAVLGMTTPAIPNWLSPEIWSGLRFDDMVSTAKKWMKVIRSQEKADVVIGLFHSGKEGGITTTEYMEDAAEVVAKEVPGFDLVFFGHDHTRHDDTVTNTDGHKVVCLDPANNAMSVADARIFLTKQNGKWKIDSIQGNIQNITKEPIDKDYEAHFASYINKVNNFTNEQIGTFKHSIRTADSYFGNSAFNDLILNLELQLTGADVAFTAPLLFNDSIKAGPIYMSDMFKLYKYENMLYVMRLTGDEIRKHLEMSYDLWFNTMTSPDDHLLLLDQRTEGDAQRVGFKNLLFNFDSAAGINYTVDVTKPNGQKVSILSMSNGQPFDPKQWYRVAINSYRANGGGELLTKGAGIPKDSLAGRIVWKSDRDQRYYLMQEIKRQKVLDPQPNNNWKVVPEAWTRPAAKRDYELLFGNRNKK